MKFKNTSDHNEAYIKAILEQSGIVELVTKSVSGYLSSQIPDEAAHEKRQT